MTMLLRILRITLSLIWERDLIHHQTFCQVCFSCLSLTSSWLLGAVDVTSLDQSIIELLWLLLLCCAIKLNNSINNTWSEYFTWNTVFSLVSEKRDTNILIDSSSLPTQIHILEESWSTQCQLPTNITDHWVCRVLIWFMCCRLCQSPASCSRWGRVWIGLWGWSGHCDSHLSSCSLHLRSFRRKVI